MIHQPMGGAQGQAEDIKVEAAQIVRIKENLVKLYSMMIGPDRRFGPGQHRRICRQGTWTTRARRACSSAASKKLASRVVDWRHRRGLPRWRRRARRTFWVWLSRYNASLLAPLLPPRLLRRRAEALTRSRPRPSVQDRRSGAPPPTWRASPRGRPSRRRAGASTTPASGCSLTSGTSRFQE